MLILGSTKQPAVYWISCSAHQSRFYEQLITTGVSSLVGAERYLSAYFRSRFALAVQFLEGVQSNGPT